MPGTLFVCVEHVCKYQNNIKIACIHVWYMQQSAYCSDNEIECIIGSNNMNYNEIFETSLIVSKGLVIQIFNTKILLLN